MSVFPKLFWYSFGFENQMIHGVILPLLIEFLELFSLTG